MVPGSASPSSCVTLLRARPEPLASIWNAPVTVGVMSTLATGPVHSRPGKALLHAGPRGHSVWLLLLCPSRPCGFSQCMRALVQDVSRNGRVSGFHMSPASWGFRWSLLHVFYLLFFAALFPLLSSFPSAPTLSPSVAAPWGSSRLPDVQAGLGTDGEAF